MIGRVFAIALNTLREAVRDRILYAVVGLAAAALLFTRLLAELSLDQQDRVVRDLGIAVISLFSVLVALFLGSSLLYKEIERKTLYMILPKPIHRWEFILGKFGGIALTGYVFLAMIGGLFMLLVGQQAGGDIWTPLLIIALGIVALIMGVKTAPDPTMVVVPWAIVALAVSTLYAGHAGEPIAPHLRGLILIAGELSVLTAVAMFFSSFSTPFLTGALSAGIWVVGRNADTLQSIQSRMLTEELVGLLHAIAEVVPNFNLFVPGQTTIGPAATDPWFYVGTTMLYGAGFATLLLVFASLIFRRRDLA